MNETKHDHEPHGDPNGGSNHPGHRPYWQHAHRDWRLWVFAAFMLAALMIYLTSYELPWWPRGRTQPPFASDVGK